VESKWKNYHILLFLDSLFQKLKEEALDHTLWRTGFGRGYECVIRQTAE
jgi:hypothetical protein